MQEITQDFESTVSFVTDLYKLYFLFFNIQLGVWSTAVGNNITWYVTDDDHIMIVTVAVTVTVIVTVF